MTLYKIGDKVLITPIGFVNQIHTIISLREFNGNKAFTDSSMIYTVTYYNYIRKVYVSYEMLESKLRFIARKIT